MATLHERTERVALDLALRYERSAGREAVYVGSGWPSAPLLRDVRHWADQRHPATPGVRISCDFVSRGPDGQIRRLIEVKGRRGSSTSISIVDRQRNAALALGGDWWLYVGLDCGTDAPRLIVVEEPHLLPWSLLTPPVDLPVGETRRVNQEGIWHVMPADVIACGTEVTFPS